jgi:hypothetical protein
MAGWINRLKQRWGVSTKQVFIILLVFAMTGTTIVFLKKPVLALFTADGSMNMGASIMYYILILPVYNIFLLFYGFLVGQFSFFWAYEKSLLKKIFRRK